MDGLKNNKNNQIAQNAHSVEREPSNVMSVESLNKRVYTMKKISLEQAKIMSKTFNLTLEEMIESGMVATPKVAGGKGMDILASLEMKGKSYVKLPANLEIELSELQTGQKLQALKNLARDLNESDDFEKCVKHYYPNLVEGLQVEFNWKDKSKINKK